MVEVQLLFGQQLYQTLSQPFQIDPDLSPIHRKVSKPEMDEEKSDKNGFINTSEEGLFGCVSLDSMLRDTRENCRDNSKAELTSFLKFKDENMINQEVKDTNDKTDEEGSISSIQSNGEPSQPGSSKKKPKRKCQPEEGSSDLGWLMNFSAAKLFKPSLQDMTNQNNIRTKESRVDPKFNKPGMTYTEMIERALMENGRLTVSEIYKWIQTNFPYFDKDDPRWKNSVRHNLSINPQFRKGEKSDKGGSGHYWRLNKDHDEKYSQWQADKGTPKPECSKKKPETSLEEIHDDLEECLDDEVQRATRSILRYADPMPYSSSPIPDVLRDFYMGPNVEVELIHNTPPVWDESSSDNFDPILNDSILFSDTANLALQSFDLVTKM